MCVIVLCVFVCVLFDVLCLCAYGCASVRFGADVLVWLCVCVRVVMRATVCVSVSVRVCLYPLCMCVALWVWMSACWIGAA